MAKADPLDDALDSVVGGTPPTITPEQHDLLDNSLDSVFAPPPVARAELRNGPQASPWGFEEELGNGLLLGGGVALRSASEAVADAFRLHSDPRFANVPFETLLRSAYNSHHMMNAAARDAYGTENPGSALLGDLAGGTVPTGLAAALGQEYAIAPAARAITGALPEAAPVVNFLTGTLPRGASAIARFGSRALTGGAMGALSGVMQSGLSDRPLGEQTVTGAATGALLNPLLGTAGDQFASDIAPRIAQQARTLMKNGIPLNAGQIPGANWFLQLMHNRLGDASGAPQRTALTQALTRTFGEDSPVLDNNLISSAENRIGKLFQRFEGATIQKDAPLQDSIVDTLAAAHGDLHTGTGIPEDKLASLRDAAALIAKAGTKQELSGADYLTLTKRGSTLDRLARDPDVGFHAAELRDALDAALERSVAGSGGRWVPAGAAMGTAGAAPTTVTAPNALLGRSGAVAQPLLPGRNAPAVAGPAEGTIEPPEGTPPQPGMIWQIDPQTQGALQLLRDARGQYRNLMLARGIMNDTTGEIQPKQLATRIAKFYPPSKFTAARGGPSRWEQSALDLAPASQFIPNGPGGASTPNKLLQAAHGLGAGAGAIAVEHLGAPLIEGLMHDPMALALTLAGGAAGTAASRGAVRLLDSPANANRLLVNATRAPSYSAALTPNMLLTPSAVQLYNRGPKRQYRQNGTKVEYRDPGETEWRAQ